MCGIVFKQSFDSKDVVNDVLQQFDAQRERGTQGFGIYDAENLLRFRAQTEEDMLTYLCGVETSFLLFHHRFPTSTVNVSQAAHPIRTHKYFGKTEYVMVHNGVISNSKELKAKHEALGISYETQLQDGTFNDSESLLWELALITEGKLEKPRVQGYLAFIMLQILDGQVRKLYYGRHTAPLNIYKTSSELELSSLGRGVSIPADQLHEVDYQTGQITKRDMEFTVPYVYPKYAYNQGYKPKEYHPQGTYNSYDDYYQTRKQKAEDNWQRLRRKFSKHLSDGRYSGEDYRVDKETVLKNKSYYLPSSSEVQNLAMDYLVDAQGNFEEAFYQMEWDYAQFLEESEGQETMADVRKQLQYEAAMEFIDKDPEYINEHSISSIWVALWAKPKKEVKRQLRLKLGAVASA